MRRQYVGGILQRLMHQPHRGLCAEDRGDGLILATHKTLWQIAQPFASCQGDRTRVGVLDACDDAQQRTFSTTIWADNTGVLARSDAE